VRIAHSGRQDVAAPVIAQVAHTEWIWFASSWVVVLQQERRRHRVVMAGPRRSAHQVKRTVSSPDATAISHDERHARRAVEVAPDQEVQQLALLADIAAYASPDGTRSGRPPMARSGCQPARSVPDGDCRCPAISCSTRARASSSSSGSTRILGAAHWVQAGSAEKFGVTANVSPATVA